MIHFLSSWVEQMAIGIAIISIFEMILPNGKLKKYVKMILGVYVVFNIISPFVNSDALYNFREESIENYTQNLITNSSNINQESMDKRLEILYIEQIETNIANKVSELGYDTEKCKVEAVLNSKNANSGINKINLIVKEKQNENDIQKVHVNQINIGNVFNVNNESNNKKIKELKRNLAEYYEIDESVINIKIIS